MVRYLVAVLASVLVGGHAVAATYETLTAETTYSLDRGISDHAEPTTRISARSWSSISVDEARVRLSRTVELGYAARPPPEMRGLRFGEQPLEVTTARKPEAHGPSLDTAILMAGIASVFLTPPGAMAVWTASVLIGSVQPLTGIVTDVTERREGVLGRQRRAGRGGWADTDAWISPADHSVAFGYFVDHISSPKSRAWISAYLFETLTSWFIGEIIDASALRAPAHDLDIKLAGAAVEPLISGTVGDRVREALANTGQGSSSGGGGGGGGGGCPPPIVISGGTTIPTVCMSRPGLASLTAAPQVIQLSALSATPIYPQLAAALPAQTQFSVAAAAPGRVTLIPAAVAEGGGPPPPSGPSGGPSSGPSRSDGDSRSPSGGGDRETRHGPTTVTLTGGFGGFTLH